MANDVIRTAIRINGLKHWQVAELLNISESTFVKKLRRELDIIEKEKILKVINKERGE